MNTQDDATKTSKLFLVKKDDWFYVADFPNERDLEDQWRHYVASYTSLEETEGVQKQRLTPVVLARNMREIGFDPKVDAYPPLGVALDADSSNIDAQATLAATESSVGARLLARFLGARNDENLVIRIALNDYKVVWSPNTAEGFYEDAGIRQGSYEAVKEAEEVRPLRAEGIKEKYERNNKAMKELTHEAVEKANIGFRDLVDGKVTEEVEVGGEGEGMDVDE